MGSSMALTSALKQLSDHVVHITADITVRQQPRKP